MYCMVSYCVLYYITEELWMTVVNSLWRISCPPMRRLARGREMKMRKLTMLRRKSKLQSIKVKRVTGNVNDPSMHMGSKPLKPALYSNLSVTLDFFQCA